MPPLDEGSLLFMPTTLPGISVAEARRLMQEQDRILMTFPEVSRVLGKAGRAETPTDPAPLGMLETTIVLKPHDQWRPGMTADRLIRESTHGICSDCLKRVRTETDRERNAASDG